MTSLQLNAEMLRNMSIIAEDENLLRRATKYLRKLVAEKQNDSALISREEFFASIKEGEEQYSVITKDYAIRYLIIDAYTDIDPKRF